MCRDSKQQTANSKQQTANSKQQTANYLADFDFVKYLTAIFSLFYHFSTILYAIETLFQNIGNILSKLWNMSPNIGNVLSIIAGTVKSFQYTEDAYGKVVDYAAAYENSSGKRGPWSNVVSLWIMRRHMKTQAASSVNFAKSSVF